MIMPRRVLPRLSRVSAIVAAACLFLVPGCEPQRPRQEAIGRSSSVKGVVAKPVMDESAANDAYHLVNEARVGRGMPALTRRPELDAVAHAHARDLLRMNRLSHVSSDGRLLENRLARLDWVWAGENLARNKGFEAPSREAVRGWIASPKHHDNMFRPDFTQCGMAALYDPESGFTYFVQVFIIPV